MRRFLRKLPSLRFKFCSGFLTFAKKLGLSTPELENYDCCVFSHATVVQ
jgi:hypothetical protein